MPIDSRRSILAWTSILGVGFAVGAGCMNGSLQNFKARVNDGPARFALVIEADRTLIRGTHFLLDTATGDVWRMESSDGRTGAWVRLGDAPADVTPLEPEEAAEDA